MPFGDLENGRQLCRNTERVDYENSASPGSDGFFDLFRVNVESVWIDVRKHGCSAFIADGISGGDEGKRRKDDLIALSAAQCPDAQMQEGCGGGAGPRVGLG